MPLVARPRSMMAQVIGSTSSFVAGRPTTADRPVEDRGRLHAAHVGVGPPGAAGIQRHVVFLDVVTEPLQHLDGVEHGLPDSGSSDFRLAALR